MTALLDLVAVAYDAPDETGRFLDSLRHVGVPFTFTLVDNASPDERARRVISDRWADVLALPDLTRSDLIFNGRNAGFAAACNTAAAIGDAPFLVLLNCDTQWRPGVAETVLSTFAGDEAVGIVGPRTVDSHGRLTHSGVLPIGPGGRFAHRHWLQPDRGQASDVIDAATVPGAVLFARRAMWTALADCPRYRSVARTADGPLLPTKHFFEDTWCCVHARAHNWRVVYDGRACMIHEWDRSEPGTATRHHAESRAAYLAACRAHGIAEHGTRGRP